MHTKTPYKWLLGVRPRSPRPALAAALLTSELGGAITTAELGWGGADIEAVSAMSGLVLPWTAAGSLHAVRVVSDAGSMDRRILLTLLGAAACTPAHEWLLARPEADAAVGRSSGSPLSVGVIDGLDDIVGQLRRMDDQVGGETLAETARAGYPGATPRVAAMLDLRAAEAHAHDRAITECRRALDSAFDRLGDTPSSSGEPGWCYWLDEAQTHAYAGACYLHLEDWGRARKHLRTTLHLQNPSYARDGALRHIDLATTYLRQDQPEVDHAVSLASRAVQTLSGEVDSARCVGHLARFVGDLAPYRRRPAVRQLTEQAAGLLRQ